MICTFSPHDYLYETFKQPYALVPHLYPVATGSAFLVDPKGKPKDNISVSVIPLRLGWQRRPISREVLRGAAVWHGNKSSVGHILIQTIIPRWIAATRRWRIPSSGSTGTHHGRRECSQMVLRD